MYKTNNVRVTSLTDLKSLLSNIIFKMEWRLISRLGWFALRDRLGLSIGVMFLFTLHGWLLPTEGSLNALLSSEVSSGNVNGVTSSTRGWITWDRSRDFCAMLVGLMATRFRLYVPPLEPIIS